MPELPEVETIRREVLKAGLVGQRLVVCGPANCGFGRPREKHHVFVSPPANLNEPLKDVLRYGKYLFLAFPSGYTVCHFGMSGRLAVGVVAPADVKYMRYEFRFSDRRRLRLIDVRRFGSVDWYEGNHIEEYSRVARFGPDALSEELTAGYLYATSRGRTIPVKSFIMNQEVVAGIGNIYANEALFDAGIHPYSHAGGISQNRFGRLVEAIRSVLHRAISSGGATLQDGVFLGVHSTKGRFQDLCRVYDRGGQPCCNCGRQLLSKPMCARQTIYCANCQYKGYLSKRTIRSRS